MVVCVARQQRTTARILPANHVQGGFLFQITSNPFGVAGNLQMTASRGAIHQPQLPELHRPFAIDKHPQTAFNAALLMFEYAIAKAMSRAVFPLSRARLRRRRPQIPPFHITDIQRLPAPIGHRIVMPGRQAIFMRILIPSVRLPTFTDHRTKMRVRQDIAPRHRSFALSI